MKKFISLIILAWKLISKGGRGKISQKDNCTTSFFRNCFFSKTIQFFFIFQIIIGAYVSPLGQDKARNFIRNSNVDFFPSLFQEGKFIDVVKNLSIFIESEEADGTYNNIFLKEINIIQSTLKEGSIIQKTDLDLYLNQLKLN